LEVTYPDSPLSKRYQLLLAYAALEAREGAESLRLLQRYLQRFPNSKETDHLRFSIAESFALLKQYDDAIKTYKSVVQTPYESSYGVEAEYRIGDIFFMQNKYEAALQAYEDVQKRYPKFVGVFPNVQYNKSEALFWLKRPVLALPSFIDFLKHFPRHEYGGYVMARIGELHEILGADQKTIVGTFTEGYFRFPKSPGSEVARIRLLSQALKDMNEREKKQAMEEIKKVETTSWLPSIQEFTTLMKSDGLSRRQEYRNSLELLLNYFTEYPSTPSIDMFKARIVRNISDILKSDIEKKNFISALNFFGKYSSTWTKNTERIDLPYFQALAYQQAGVPSEAISALKAVREKLKPIVGTKQELERKVHENLPSLSQVNLRLAASFVDVKNYADANEALKGIGKDLSPVEDIERVQIGALVAEHTGDLSGAANYLEELLKKTKAEGHDLVSPKLQLARLYLATGKMPESDARLSEVERQEEAGMKLTGDLKALQLELRGNWQLKSQRRVAAVETYLKLLDSFEAEKLLTSVRYRVGNILFEDGDIKGAEKVWSRINPDTGAFYKQLSQEKLNQAQWQDTYKKYINRIPAAQGLR
jgi:outer membrane protein assembly factor BamD (BamD/ComL family)